jgi:hypothetical protein
MEKDTRGDEGITEHTTRTAQRARRIPLHAFDAEVHRGNYLV